MSRTGLPHPASLLETIEHLFQNEKLHNADGTNTIISFSRVTLTADQKNQLVYPEGLIPIDYFVAYQTDRFREKEVLETNIQLVSFVQRRDYIYGVYFEVEAQPRFNIEDLINSKDPVSLFNTARLIPSLYLEIYNEIEGIIVILSLSTLNPDPSASLQYSHGGKYYYEQIYNNGIRGADQFIPVTNLTGLSKNLRLC